MTATLRFERPPGGRSESCKIYKPLAQISFWTPVTRSENRPFRFVSTSLASRQSASSRLSLNLEPKGRPKSETPANLADFCRFLPLRTLKCPYVQRNRSWELARLWDNHNLTTISSGTQARPEPHHQACPPRLANIRAKSAI